MNSRLRILYALGCALVLSVYSLTPRSTFAQQPTSAAVSPNARAGAVMVTRAHANVRTVTAGGPAENSERSTTEQTAAAPSEHARAAMVARADSSQGALTGPPAAASPITAAQAHVRADSVTAAPSAHGLSLGAGAAPNEHTGAGTIAATADAAAASQRATASEGVVNLNTATAAELERLPRVGPARAQAILDLRAKLTHFSKVEQLLRVKGIGRATFRKLRPLLALDGLTTLPERKTR